MRSALHRLFPVHAVPVQVPGLRFQDIWFVPQSSLQGANSDGPVPPLLFDVRQPRIRADYWLQRSCLLPVITFAGFLQRTLNVPQDLPGKHKQEQRYATAEAERIDDELVKASRLIGDVVEQNEISDFTTA